jgi:RNA polymerase sigma factor (sigma-70 family)
MVKMNDCDLVKAYAETHSEEAFAELVRRHVDLVFSAALRQVGGDQHLAQDVVQCVFNDLARKAGTFSSRVVLSGWLYTSAHFAAAKMARTEQRRRIRETSHFMQQPSDRDAEPSPDWDRLQTVLDDAMHDLKEADRNAIVLRFFQGCDFRAVGEKIGASSDSARMRVDRALEKLRKLLAKRGIVSTSAALAAVLAEQSIVAAPAGLAASVASSAISGAAAGTAVTWFQFMAMTKIKAAAIAIAVAGFSVPIVLQYKANQGFEESNRTLRQQHAEAIAELEPLKSEVQRLSNLVAQPAIRPESSNELFQLRAEVARLRGEAKQAGRTRAIAAATASNDPVQETLRSLGLRAEELKKRLSQMPETQIPELALISEKDWIDAAATVDSMQTDMEARKALNSLRSAAKQKFGNNLQGALRKFAEANGDALPTDLSQLQPYLDPAIDSTLLDRYQLARSGKYSEGEGPIVKEVAPPVDPEYDSIYNFFRDGTSSRSVNTTSDAILDATTRFAAANNGQLPRDPSQLAGLLPAEIDPQKVQNFLAKIPSDVTTLDQFRSAGKRSADRLPAR